MDLRTDQFDYDLPGELIAQQPTPRRDGSRLLVIDRRTETFTHRHFYDLPEYLQMGDVLVANRSRVRPARLLAHRETGGAVELLLLHSTAGHDWIALARPSRKLRPGMTLNIDGSRLEAILRAPEGDGRWSVTFRGEGDIATQLRQAGTLALPPYIRATTAPPDRYQTIYADREGSIAAPTAGLHFSPLMLDTLRQRGISLQFVTLHVGIGTFKPITTERVQDHHMHPEWGEVDASTALVVNAARAAGRRVFAVGTTTTRILESAFADGALQTLTGETNRFMYPGYRFQAIDCLITNFHLPRSTLLMLVSAFAGRELILEAYREAVLRKYRFFSFGDAMLIL